MKTKQTIIATLTGAILLFLFDGAFQAIPHFGVRAVERIESNDLTTKQFEALTDRMSYIATEDSVSFVATKKADYYNLSRFFAIEFASAFFIAWVFALLFARINLQNLRERVLLTAVFAVAASFAIHVPYWNWWGFSLPYTIGVIAKTLVGWTLIAYVQNRFIFKIK